MLKALLKALGIYRLYEKWLLHQIKNKPLPSHIAVILDGNRRWARSRGLPPWAGHEVGARNVEKLLDWCLELGIKTVTLYVFSLENFYRPKEEVNALMRIIERYLKKLRDDPRIHKYRVRVRALGRKYLLPKSIQELLTQIEELTKDYDNFFLNIAIAYGGRAEIVDAVRSLVQDVLRNKVKPEEISEDLLSEYLYTAHLPNPDPDLIIRTSGEERLSGFLLWQCAYSELVFLDVYWPDFRKIDLLRAIRTYQQRQRRFGR
ncbi:MAG: di-trans,poly-cis-decaprenylcistransferase [Thermoprotei archaeon]|nr:MAG: di-trans,poly-cis-decaprenylcistransferase [Thermoprotei archaeon]RLF19562.1 MAG: di-trans,poly-cis-decaprenylcistransferase [Thermoprotei archaeon]